MEKQFNPRLYRNATEGKLSIAYFYNKSRGTKFNQVFVPGQNRLTN